MDDELFGRQSALAEARALLPLLDHGSGVEEVRRLIGVSPEAERVLRAFAQAHPEERAFIERAIKFRKAVLEEFNRLVREKAAFPESVEIDISGPESFTAPPAFAPALAQDTDLQFQAAGYPLRLFHLEGMTDDASSGQYRRTLADFKPPCFAE